jgi:hypothetical protein
VGGHHAEFAGGDEAGKVFDLLCERRLIFVLGCVGVGGFAARIRVGEVAGRHGEGPVLDYLKDSCGLCELCRFQVAMLIWCKYEKR